MKKKKMVLMLTLCLSSLSFASSCHAQEDNRIVKIGPDVSAELVFFFKKGTTWREILEFQRTVIGIPEPNGTGFSDLPGIMSGVKIEIDGFEGEAINFKPDATDEEKVFVKIRVSESPLIYKIYENVVPNQITDLNPNSKRVQRDKVSEPPPGKSKKVVTRWDK